MDSGGCDPAADGGDRAERGAHHVCVLCGVDCGNADCVAISLQPHLFCFAGFVSCGTRNLVLFCRSYSRQRTRKHGARGSGLLLPLDFVLLSVAQEKGFTFSSVAPPALMLFVESVMVAVLCRPDPLASAPRAWHHSVPPHLPFATLIAFAAAAIILLIRFLLFRKPVESGLLWALAATALALRFGGVGRIPSAYFATAAFILAVSMVETSYLLAYHDELTALPSRRAFHEALLRLQPLIRLRWSTSTTSSAATILTGTIPG